VQLISSYTAAEVIIICKDGYILTLHSLLYKFLAPPPLHTHTHTHNNKLYIIVIKLYNNTHPSSIIDYTHLPTHPPTHRHWCTHMYRINRLLNDDLPVKRARARERDGIDEVYVHTSYIRYIIRALCNCYCLCIQVGGLQRAHRRPSPAWRHVTCRREWIRYPHRSLLCLYINVYMCIHYIHRPPLFDPMWDKCAYIYKQGIIQVVIHNWKHLNYNNYTRCVGYSTVHCTEVWVYSNAQRIEIYCIYTVITAGLMTE